MKKFTKILALALVVAMIFSFAACGGTKDDSKAVKIGLICLHDENSTYDANFINALKDVQKELGLKDEQVLIKTNIPESSSSAILLAIGKSR